MTTPPKAKLPGALPAALPQSLPRSLPRSWINAHEDQTRLWTSLAQAPHSLLICDYDGTLAPFKADKMTAVPFPGVAERLEKIAALPNAKLALVSGRPVAELITLFPLASQLELYGSHGREHRSASGLYRLSHASLSVKQALDAAAEDLAQLGYQGGHQGELERKEASLAVHWRNLSPADQAALAEAAQKVFAQHTQDGEQGMSILPFESGMELRANDHTKAHAVQALLNRPGDHPVTAYLGDDTTDEDAFDALGSRGLSLLVRDEPRPSLAGFWLRPPAQLIGFLDDWLRAAGRSSLSPR